MRPLFLYAVACCRRKNERSKPLAISAVILERSEVSRGGNERAEYAFQKNYA